MKTYLLLAAGLALAPGIATAAGNHAGGHGDDHMMMAVGEPGTADKVSRTVTIRMTESDDGKMLFEPARLDVRKGETVRFKVENRGELEHEFVLDDHDRMMEHKEAMMKMPEMEHDDPNAVRLDPGMKGEVIWTFANAGSFEFGCLIPGHYESGMKGDVTVADD